MGALAEPTRQLVRLRGRSYVAFVFCPAVPIVGWLEELDATIARSPGFFVGKPVVLDLSALDLSQSAIAHLVASLEQRSIRVLGIEGADAARLTASLPPLLTGGRHCVVKSSEPEKPEAKPKSTLTAARNSGALRSVGGFYRRRRDRAGFGGLRRGNRGRWLDPCLRSTSRPGDGGGQRQLERPDILPEDRGRTTGHRRLLPDCGRNRRLSTQSASPGVAGRRDHANHSVELIG